MVQVPAPALLRPVVHLSASVRESVPLQGAGSPHRLRRPQENANKETAAPRRGPELPKALLIPTEALLSVLALDLPVCTGVLPGADAAVWPVWPTCPGRPSPV